MRRREGLVAVAAGLVETSGALAWLFGGYGLLAAGVLVTAVSLFALDVKED